MEQKYICFKEFIHSIYLKGKKTTIFHLLVHSLPKGLYNTQAKGRSLGLSLHLPHGYLGLSYLSCHLLAPLVHISKNLDCRMELRLRPGTLTQQVSCTLTRVAMS